MEWIKTLFSGLGTRLLSDFWKKLSREKDDNKSGKHTKFKQIQKGKDSSELEQIYKKDSSDLPESNSEDEVSVVVQKQVAGNNSKLTQIGVIKHGR